MRHFEIIYFSMPSKPIGYSKTHFYKIVCKDTNIQDIYLGHTTQFTKRKSHHKTRCCNPNNPKHHYKVYKFIRENGHWDNWEMILINTIDCKNHLEALAKEREYYDELKPSLNMLEPMRTDEEKQSGMLRRMIKSNDKVSQDRKYNPDKYRELDRITYLKRKDKLNEYNKEKITCDCGLTYTRGNKTNHLKTLTHKQYSSIM